MTCSGIKAKQKDVESAKTWNGRMLNQQPVDCEFSITSIMKTHVYYHIVMYATNR